MEENTMRIIKIIFILVFYFISAVWLSGCLAVAAGGTAGYLVAKDKGAVGTYTSDSIITSKIKARFLAEESIHSFNVSVSTNKGVVSLSGEVGSAAARHLAIRLAQTTSGVRRVLASNLVVSP